MGSVGATRNNNNCMIKAGFLQNKTTLSLRPRLTEVFVKRMLIRSMGVRANLIAAIASQAEARQSCT